MTDELMPCPFCGQIDHVSDSYFDDRHVGCFRCVVFVDRDDWQKRPIEDALNARIAALESECAALRKALDTI